MSKQKSIGAGTEASVFGPFSASHIRGLGINNRLPEDANYVVKVYMIDTDKKQVLKRQSLLDKLRREMQHDTILYPLLVRYMKGSFLMDKFDMPQPLVPYKEYKVEVQQYGGQDFFYLLFERTPKKVFTNAQFLKLWACMADILEDLHAVLFKHHCVITDIKMENMVMTNDYKLRLVDLQISSDKSQQYRIFTGDILRTPTQFFHKTWWVKDDPTRYIERYKRQTNRIMTGNPSHTWYDVMSYVYGDRNTIDQWVQQYSTHPHQLTVTDKDAHKWLFALYPILMAAVYMIYSKRVRITDDKRIDGIIKFCLWNLRGRGQGSASEDGFRVFLKKMRSFLPVKKTKPVS